MQIYIQIRKLECVTNYKNNNIIKNTLIKLEYKDYK